MKKLISLLTVITVIFMSYSCTPDINPVLPEDVTTGIGSGDELGDEPADEPGDEEQGIEPEPDPEPQPDPDPEPDPTPDPEPEPDPTPEPDPNDIFILDSQSYREVLYNEHKFAVRVRSNCGIEVEIPEESKTWISMTEVVDYIEGSFLVWFKVEGLPETMIGTSFIPDTCSGEDRTVGIVFRNTARTRSFTVTIKQLCYGCSAGFEEGDDQIVIF